MEKSHPKKRTDGKKTPVSVPGIISVSGKKIRMYPANLQHLPKRKT